MNSLERKDIEGILPHRAPFLFVDRVTELEEGARIRGELAVEDALGFAKAHNGLEVIPSTILAEAMAQVGAILALFPEANRGRTIYFRSIEDAELKREVPAGAPVQIEAKVRRMRSRFGSLSVVAECDGEVVASAIMSFALG